ncbi:MAG: GDP-mannose 4,6-dehydratase, partial [Patescibacteria group bacterium]|nr:GDP-mannose 4,6-dehydratase [Patescibacteria group bacterium]
ATASGSRTRCSPAPARRGQPMPQGHGQLARDYLYVEDAARALAALVDRDVRGPVNIGSGNPTPLRDLVLAAARELDARDRVQINAQPPRAGEPLSFRADTERLRTEVGFSPQYGLPAGMAASVAWWKGQLGIENATMASRREEMP